MGLSARKQKSLSALYETWGTDRVRRDLQRHQYPSLLSTDFSDYERAWLNSKDAQGQRRQQFGKVVKVLFVSLLIGVAAAFFIS